MRALAFATVALCLFVVTSSDGVARQADPGDVGPYAVGHIGFIIVDPLRAGPTVYAGRPIYVSVWYPADASAIGSVTQRALYPIDPINSRAPVSTSANWERYGLDAAYEGVPISRAAPFPLIVYSPGWMNPYWSGLFTATRLASHGFVVAALTHWADGAYQWEPFHALHVANVNRPRDVSFALSDLLSRSGAAAGLLSGAIRPDQVAAMGHSLGGYAALVLAGGDDLVCDRPSNEPFGRPIPPETCIASHPDPRIKAIVTFDGSSQILWFPEMGRINVPAMVVGQEWENIGSWHARVHTAIASEPNYRVDVQGALHPSFTTNCENARVLFDLGVINGTQLENRLRQPWCTTALPAMETQRLATKYAIAFLKTNLAREPGYQHILTPGWALTAETHIEFFVTEKTNANVTVENLPCLSGSCPAFRYFPNQPGSRHERAEERGERDPAEITGAELGPWIP
jgi:predicted dienelactone hydrolase